MASGNGFDMGSDNAFVSDFATVTVNGTSDKLLVTASASHQLVATGSFESSSMAQYFIGVRPTGGSTFSQFGAKQIQTFWQRPDTSYKFQTNTVTMSTIVTGLPAGTYEIGLVGSCDERTLTAQGSNVTVQKVAG
jgi:hypothetical protein